MQKTILDTPHCGPKVLFTSLTAGVIVGFLFASIILATSEVLGVVKVTSLSLLEILTFYTIISIWFFVICGAILTGDLATD